MSALKSPVQFVDAFVAKLYLPDAGFLRVTPPRPIW
jgi:hypothetical protein